MLKRLQKLSATASALREAFLLKESGAGSAVVKGVGNAALETGAAAGKAIEGHLKKQVKKHGLIGAALGTAGGLALAGGAAPATSNTYKAYKSGFNPKLHKAELGLD